MPFAKPSWFGVIHSHFVLCTVLGLIVLDASRDGLRELLKAEGGPNLLDVASGSLVSGIIVAGATWLIHRTWFRKLRERYRGRGDAHPDVAFRGATVGFVCGALSPLYIFVPYLMVILALVFLALIVAYFRTFIARAAIVLRPGNYPRPPDILSLVFLYGAIIACFTVLNAALVGIHKVFGVHAEAFQGFPEGAVHFIDTFYFTVVVMTTLGFGDITPVTADAKLVVAFEVVIAYLMFALLIGTITRGILPHESAGETPQEDPPESR